MGALAVLLLMGRNLVQSHFEVQVLMQQLAKTKCGGLMYWAKEQRKTGRLAHIQ